MTVEFFFSEQQSLQIENQSLRALIAKRDERISFYENEVEHLKEMLNELRRRTFGKSSERWLNQDQGELAFNEAEATAAAGEKSEDEDAAKSEDEGTPVKGHTRKRGNASPCRRTFLAGPSQSSCQ